MIRAVFFLLVLICSNFFAIPYAPLRADTTVGSPEGFSRAVHCGCGATLGSDGLCTCLPGLIPLSAANDTLREGLICGRACPEGRQIDLSVGESNRYCRACTLPATCGTDVVLGTTSDGTDYVRVCKDGRQPLRDLNPAYPAADTCTFACPDGSAPDPSLHLAGVAKDAALCAYCKPSAASCSCGQIVRAVSVPGGQIFACACADGRQTVDSVLHNGDQRCFSGSIPAGGWLDAAAFDSGKVNSAYANRCIGFHLPPLCGQDANNYELVKDASGRATGDLRPAACLPGRVTIDSVLHNGDKRCFDGNVPQGFGLDTRLYDSGAVDAAYQNRCVGLVWPGVCGVDRTKLKPKKDVLGRVTGDLEPTNECLPGRVTVDSVLHNGDPRCFDGNIPAGFGLSGALFDNGTVDSAYQGRCVGLVYPGACGTDSSKLKPRRDYQGRATGDLEPTGECISGWVTVDSVLHNGDLRCFDPKNWPAGGVLTAELFDNRTVDPAYANRCVGFSFPDQCGYTRVPERDGFGRATGNFVLEPKANYPGTLTLANYSTRFNDGWSSSGSQVVEASVTCNAGKVTAAHIKIKGKGGLGAVNYLTYTLTGETTGTASFYRPADGLTSGSLPLSISKNGNSLSVSTYYYVRPKGHEGPISGTINLSCGC